MAPRLLRILFLLTFLLATALRLGLSLVNREANDPHLEVAQIILQNNRLPTRDDCWECFQPKLYHIILAKLFQAGQIYRPAAQIVAANLFSAAAGVLTLAALWRWMAQLGLTSRPTGWLAFTLAALNPKLIGINAQATNDSLLILFSTLALHQAWNLLQAPKNSPASRSRVSFGLACLFTFLAASTKTNGWVTFTAILLALLIRALRDPANRLRLETYALAWLLIVPAAVSLNPLNQYFSNVQKYGTPLVTNINRAAPPALFEPTPTNKPGLLSIQDGFFTFKLSSLLATPYINPEPQQPLPHRTSFWTQLYGRAHSVNFDNWPATWRSDNPAGFPLRRAIYLLALLPTGLLLAGTVRESARLLRGADENALFLLVWLGYLSFVALYAWIYREYPVMKAIFLYPALPAFPVLFHNAAQKLPGRAIQLLIALSILLFALYVTDVLTLAMRLAAIL